MRHSLLRLASILVFAKIGCLDSRAVEVILTGTGCECAKQLPYQVDIPVAPPPPEPTCLKHGYKVEVPVQAKAKYSYSFDFVVEEPLPPPPPPTCKHDLFAAIDKIVLTKPDCTDTLPPPPLPMPPPPVLKPCPFDKTKECTCGLCKPAKLPLDYDYDVDVPVISKSCACGQCSPLSPPKCRYVFSGIRTNRISRSSGSRSKRDISSKKQHYISEIRDYVKSLKAALDARKTHKSRLTKRDIKGEYDLLQKDQAALDLTIPDVIQYMPETLMPNFKRGKCNIGCKNCLSKHMEENSEHNSSPTESIDMNKDSESQRAEAAADVQAEGLAETHFQRPINNQPNFFNQHFVIAPPFGSASYLKRSVNPYQYPCYPSIMPPPYIPNPLHMASLAENPGNPVWYQPRPLIDPNGEYVYDRLGHKYEVKNGSLKLVAPSNSADDNVSAPGDSTSNSANTNANDQTVATASATAAQQAQGEANAPVLTDPSVLQAPVVGAQANADPNYDPQMDKVIRDIIYQHPDFVDATKHASGSLTQPQNIQRDETMQFLAKLIRGRLSNWFGGSDANSNQNLQDLNRYSRETGTSIKFIPVVTIDKEKLEKYRQEKGMSLN